MPNRSIPTIRYREASGADVPAMERCRAGDPQAGPADERMAAYLDGRHHPQHALGARIAFVAEAANVVVGYIAAHATTRHECGGEVQYLFVAPPYRRHGVASALLHSVARWFRDQGIRRVCVDVDIESDGAIPFYVAEHATQMRKCWYMWEDIGIVLGQKD